MAQDSIVGGLFGITPESLDLAQRQRDEAMAIQYAGLDPMQRAAYGTFMAGQQLGRGIGSLLGIEDPQLKMITQRQQIMRGINPNDPEALSKASMLASEMGDPRLAAGLAELRRKALESQALVAQRTAAAKREQKTAIPTNIQEAQYVATLRNDRNQIAALTDSEVMARYGIEKTAALANIDAQLSQLVKPEKPMNFGAEREAIAFELYGKRVSELNQNEIAEVNRRAQKKGIGQSISEGLAQGVGMLGAALAPALKKEGEEAAKFTRKNYDELGRAVAAGVASRRDLRGLSDALQNSFTGAFADSKKSIISSLSSLGVPLDKDLLEAASNTELVDALATKYIFPLVKNFPGALAVKELETLKKAAPGSQQQLRTIVKLIDALNISLSADEYTYNQARNYRLKNKTLLGFEEADARVDFQRKYDRMEQLYKTAQSRGNKWSRQESDEFNSIKAELGVK